MVATNTILHQAGVIAYRILDGKVQVLLMTSRDTGRWIIPRGPPFVIITNALERRLNTFSFAIFRCFPNECPTSVLREGNLHQHETSDQRSGYLDRAIAAS